MKSPKSRILIGVAALAGFISALQPAFAHDGGISAREVLDRETLKAFVQAAKNHVEGITDSAQVDVFMEDQWRAGSIYVYIFNDEGLFHWHGVNASLVGRNLVDVQDLNGVRYVQRLIDAAKSGGGYVEYHFDDPSVTGDEGAGSAKVSYAETFTSPLPDLYPDQTVIIGSGFYPGHQMALDFAHFGNGSAISSDVVLINLASTPIRPAVYFYDKAGNLIDPGSVVDVAGNLETTDYGAVTLQSELASLGEITISTNGQGETVTGSVKVITEGWESPIAGVLRFDVPGVGVAGVGSSQPLREAIFPVRRMAGGINTGAAFRNLSESELTLTCHLMKDGQELEDEMVTLPGNGQDARFIDELFDTDTSNFVGSVRCTVPEGPQTFTGVAVEMDTENGVFTTLPVVALDGGLDDPVGTEPDVPEE